MRIGFLTGSIARIGSGRTEAVPLARGLSSLGSTVYGLETTRFRRSRVTVEELEVHQEPLVRYYARGLLRQWISRASISPTNDLPIHYRATGEAVHSLARRLDLDVTYAFHNTNAAALLHHARDTDRVLAINLIGFGIDRTRGGASDTFPLQNLIFSNPTWDLHVTATRFEYDQYRGVYERLGIDQQKLLQLPHSFDEEIFRLGEQESRTHGRLPGRTLLYPVNVYPRKNIELAIEILASLASQLDCRLIVTGAIWDRPYHARLLALAEHRSVLDRVSFLGGVPLDALVRLYQQADVTIYTSHQETFGHGITESLGCGTPVVGPEWIIPSREILDDAKGGSAAQKDPKAFADAVLAAMEREIAPESIAAHARLRYGNRSIAAKFLERCQEIRAAKQARAAKVLSIDWKGMYGDAGDLM